MADFAAIAHSRFEKKNLADLKAQANGVMSTIPEFLGDGSFQRTHGVDYQPAPVGQLVKHRFRRQPIPGKGIGPSEVNMSILVGNGINVPFLVSSLDVLCQGLEGFSNGAIELDRFHLLGTSLRLWSNLLNACDCRWGFRGSDWPRRILRWIRVAKGRR